MKTFFYLLFTAFLLSFVSAQKIEKKVYKTGFTKKERFEKLTIFVRYPKSYTKLKGNGKWKPTILINSHLPDSMINRVVAIANAKDKYYQLYYDLSEQYGLPLITYNCPRYYKGFYSKDGNDWELNQKIVADYFKEFLKINTIWKSSLEDFCLEQGLECKGFLGVGISIGAQYLNRSAMIHPEMFHSVESILPRTNPTPTIEAKNIHWLFISGAKDSGYAHCNRFYEKAKEIGYDKSFYIAPHEVGHGSSMNSYYLDRFKEKYYDYLLSHNGVPPANSKMFVGDYLNNIFTLKKNSAWIPESQRMYLPNAEMARAWGSIENNTF